MGEASKFRARAQREGWFDRYIHGSVIDICAGGDLITPTAREWEWNDGDAQKLVGLTEMFDTVFSSHGVEHMYDPFAAVARWWEVLKPGGYMVILAPEFDLYEQGHWPSKFNNDHKYSFTISKPKGTFPDSIHILELVKHLPSHKVISCRIIDAGFDYTKVDVDQTTMGAESSIELIVEKML